MEKLERVFFHELGHFIAGEINLKYYKGSGINEIMIYPCANNLDVYCGHTTPIVPVGVDPLKPPPIARLSQYLASLSYGCFFQSYYLKDENTKSCRKINGDEDVRGWFGGLHFNQLDHFNHQIAKTEDNFYSYLFSKHALANFMGILPASYITELALNTFSVNIEKLREDTAKLIEDHYTEYSILIEEYNVILGINN